jgi:hypothetical protein
MRLLRRGGGRSAGYFPAEKVLTGNPSAGHPSARPGAAVTKAPNTNTALAWPAGG